MITYKHRYTCNNVELIKSYERQYFICLKVVYKYLCKGFTIKQIKERLLTYKNIELIQNNSWFLASLVYEAKALISARDVCLKNLQKRYEDKDFKNYKHKQKIKKIIKQLIQKTICFNKQQHQQRSKNLITNIQFKQNNIFTLCSMGDKLKHANRYFRIQNENTIKEAQKLGADMLVLEGFIKGKIGGTGVTADWDLIAKARPLTPFFLAGGLSPENVREAMKIVQPVGVDLSSGIETAGKKDIEKMKKIVDIIRGGYNG